MTNSASGLNHSLKSIISAVPVGALGRHSAGPDARIHVDEYISGRTAEDEDLGGYTVYETIVPAPSGGDFSVAYALPQRPRAH
jgi:hypothetical protein